jgi:hypothetical protein
MTSRAISITIAMMTLSLVHGQSAFSQDSLQLPPNPQVFDVGNLASDWPAVEKLIRLL